MYSISDLLQVLIRQWDRIVRVATKAGSDSVELYLHPSYAFMTCTGATPPVLTQRSRVLLEQLTGSHLVKKFPALYGTRRFITAFLQIPATCPCPEPDQSIPSPTHHLLRIHLNIILSFTPGLLCGLFPTGFPTKTLYKHFLSPYVLYARPSHSSWFYHPKWAVKFIKRLIMYFSSHSCYMVPFRPRYFPQYLLSLRFSLNISDHISHPYKTGKIIYRVFHDFRA